MKGSPVMTKVKSEYPKKNPGLALHEMDHNYIHKLHPPIEVSSDKLLDAGLAGGVQVLKLMHGRELLHIQTVWGHHIWIINISIKTVNGQLAHWMVSPYTGASDKDLWLHPLVRFTRFARFVQLNGPTE